MRLFFAGFEHGHNPVFRNLVDDLDLRDVLVTFEYSGKFPVYKQNAFYAWAAQKRLDVMVDSGVFTLYGRNSVSESEITDLYNAYACYLLRHKGKYKYAVNIDLDRISGYTAAWSDMYYDKFKRLGLDVLPVWHYTHKSSFARLDMLAKRHEMIAIGINALRTKRGTKTDTLFRKRLDYIYGRYPDNKFHLLGLTDPFVLMEYPVYSGDSSTWIQKAKYGDIIFWNHEKCKVQYTHRSRFAKVKEYFRFMRLHRFDFKKAMNASGSGTDSLLERGRLALQAFIKSRDFINDLWRNKYAIKKTVHPAEKEVAAEAGAIGEKNEGR